MSDKVNLKNVNDPAFIEDYFGLNSLYIENYKDLYNNNFLEKDEIVWKKINKKYKDMIRNPKKYFNYNFNIHDYSKYISKNIMMRLEKNIIKKKLIDMKIYLNKINSKNINNN